MIDESLGKIIGMAMAYSVSSLGLLLAYYNYRKRVVKAERIFTPAAWLIIGGVIATVALCVFLAVALIEPAVAEDAQADSPAEVAEPVGTDVTEPGSRVAETSSPALQFSWLGTVAPATIFCFSIVLTWALYRHFARQLDRTK